MKEETFTLTRTDEAGKTTTLNIRVRAFGPVLELRPEGYGEKNAAPGEGSPAWLELGQYGLNLYASDDINSEGPSDQTSLESAREGNRWKWGVESKFRDNKWQPEHYGYATKEKAEEYATRMRNDPRFTTNWEFRVVPLDD